MDVTTAKESLQQATEQILEEAESALVSSAGATPRAEGDAGEVSTGEVPGEGYMSDESVSVDGSESVESGRAESREPRRHLGVAACGVTLLFAGAVFLVSSDFIAVGTSGPYIAGALALVLGISLHGFHRGALRRSTRRLEARAAELFRSLATGEDVETDGGGALTDPLLVARRLLAESLEREREEAVRKEVHVEVVRVRSQCERLVERHCERLQEEKKELRQTLEAEREERQAQQRDWENNSQIRDAALHDTQERIATLAGRVAQLSDDVSARVDENGRLSSEVERLLEEAASLREQRKQFLEQVMTHVRAPLRTTAHLADELGRATQGDQEEQSRSTIVELSSRIRSHGAGLQRLTEQIVDLCRLETSTVKLVYSDGDLDKLVGNVVSEVRAAATQKGVEISCEPKGDLPVVSTDQALCSKVLRDLLSNAVRFTDRGGRVTVTVKTDVDPAEGDTSRGEDVTLVEFQVADTGPGIAAGDQERIFKAFESRRGDATFGDETPGGLGLALAKGLVEYVGGDLVLRSEEGKGSTFTARIPMKLAGERPPY